MAIVRTREIVRIEYDRITSVCEDQNLFFKKNQSPYQFMCVYSAVAYFATAFSFEAQLFRNSPPFIRILNTLCSFSPFARLKMLMKGGGSPIRTLICIIKNASYVQARRFIAFYVCVLNSYFLIKNIGNIFTLLIPEKEVHYFYIV